MAEKYGISKDAIARKAKSGAWDKDRDMARDMARTESIQKVAEIASSNAERAERFKTRMLQRLERIEQIYPYDATEVRAQKGKNTVIFRIRDLTAAFKDLTGDMPKPTNDNDDPVMELLRRWDDASGQ